MRKRRSPTRLEIHRLIYRWKNGAHELLSQDELEEEEFELISSDFLLNISPGKNPELTLADVFAHWGVMCPHPQPMRLYLGKHRMFMHGPQYRWYECTCCHTSVKNEQWIQEKNKQSLQSSGGT